MSVDLAIWEGVAQITLNNPPLNLLSNQEKEELLNALWQVTAQEEIRVILLNGAGDNFCCGADLREFLSRIRDSAAGKAWSSGHEYANLLLNAPQVTVASVGGNALGGGAELMSLCDVRIMADSAKIGYPEVKRAVFPGNGGLERLVDLVGEAFAMRLILSGEIIDAQEAYWMGLVNKIVGSKELASFTWDYVNSLSALSGAALKTAKKAVKLYGRNPEEFIGQGRALFEQVHRTQDVLESVNAFFEKRMPVYVHR